MIGSEVLEKVMDGNNSLREYDVRISEEICPELEYARRLSMIFHFSPRRAYSFLMENKELVNAILKLATEEGSYSGLWRLMRKKAGFKLDVAWKVSELHKLFAG